jgi:multidrug efflux pump subunit AcrA (membrane-fusion protein)
VIGALTFVPWKLTIEGKGQIVPEDRRNTYAPVQGVVAEVFVDHADQVEKGQLLVRLTSKELEKEHRRLQAEKQSAQAQVSHLTTQLNKSGSMRDEEKQQLHAEHEAARIKVKSAQAQMDIIQDQFEMMKVTSPQAGIVTTWEAKRNLLGRPVEIGQELISVAATDGDWVLEVEVPDDDMGPVLSAQSKLQADIKAGRKAEGSLLNAYFVSATDPEHRYPGYVLRIASKAELVEQKHVVKVTVGFKRSVRDEFLKRNQALRPGAEVRARIDCGEARLAYVLLRDVVHVFYETVLFLSPFLK